MIVIQDNNISLDQYYCVLPRLTYDVNRMNDESHIIRTQTIDVSLVELNIEHDHRRVRSHGNII